MINKSKLFLFQTAVKEFGVMEIPGEKNNPRILQYASDVRMNWVQNDELSWCSIFINWCAMWSGCKMSNAPDARSWLKVGAKVETPEIGDIVIFWRESVDSWKGHVGIYVNRIDDFIYVLGGNQGNMVCIKSYPAERVLGYRDIT